MSAKVVPASFAYISKLVYCLLAAIKFITPLVKRCFHVSEEEGQRSFFRRRVILPDLVPNYVSFIMAAEAEVLGSLGNPWVQIQDD